MPEYAEIWNVPKSAWMSFVLFPHCNSLSTWTRGYWFQCLYKTRSYSMKEYEAIFLKWQNLIFSIVAGSIWLNFSIRLNIFRTKDFRLHYLIDYISKNVILPPWKATWSSTKLLWKAENRNANEKKNLHLRRGLVV